MSAVTVFFRDLAARWRPILPDQVVRLERFVEQMLTWNARINLTGARTAEDLVGEHLADAFALAELVPEGASLVDVGSGGGLPALPFAILRPDVSLTLVEPRAKRVAFLRTAAREVGSGQIRVESRRVEEVPTLRGAFDVASSRATFAPDEWLSIGGGLVREGGRVIVFTAAPHAPPPDRAVMGSVAYATASGHPRWAGAFGRR